jgi:hypothetical protein
MHPAGASLWLAASDRIAGYNLDIVDDSCSAAPAPAVNAHRDEQVVAPVQPGSAVTSAASAEGAKLHVISCGRLPVPEGEIVRSMQIGRAGRRLLAVTDGGGVYVWDLHANMIQQYVAQELEPLWVRIQNHSFCSCCLVCDDSPRYTQLQVSRVRHLLESDTSPFPDVTHAPLSMFHRACSCHCTQCTNRARPVSNRAPAMCMAASKAQWWASPTSWRACGDAPLPHSRRPTPLRMAPCQLGKAMCTTLSFSHLQVCIVCINILKCWCCALRLWCASCSRVHLH